MLATARLRGTAAFGVVLIAATAAAQMDTRTGYGNHFVPTIEVESLTGIDSFAGVVAVGGRIYATANDVNDGRPMAFVLDMDGAPVHRFTPQVPATVRLYDGATDGSSLLFASTDGVWVMDPGGRLVTTVQAASGPQAIGNPIRVATLEGASGGGAVTPTTRGLAFDPSGNGGRGSLWTGDGSSDLFEIDLDGSVLRTLRRTDAWDVHGLAFDSNFGSHATIWVHGGAGGAEPMREYDLQTGRATGNQVLRAEPRGAPGGLAGVNGAFGYFGLLALDRGMPGSGGAAASRDTITGYRIDVCGAIPGEEMAVLLTGVGEGPRTADSPKSYTGMHEQLTFSFDPRGVLNLGGPDGCVIVNPAPWSDIDEAYTPPLDEFRGVHPGSTPPGPAVIVPIVVRREPYVIQPPPLPEGRSLRVQVVYIDPRAPYGVVATNQARWVIR